MVLVGVFLPLSLSVAEPRQCEKEMKEILAFDGTVLGPIADTKTLNQMRTALADASTAYQAALKVAPKPYDRYGERQLRTPENLSYNDFKSDREYKNYIDMLQAEKRAMNDAHEKAMEPTKEALSKARFPFEEAQQSGLIRSKNAEDLTMFDKIEQHGTDPKHLSRVYSKGNRITGLVMHQYDSRLTFLLNEDCSIQKIIETERYWANWAITPQVCQASGWDKNPNATTVYELGGYVPSYSKENTIQRLKDLRRTCDSFAKLFEASGRTSTVTPKAPDK